MAFRTRLAAAIFALAATRAQAQGTAPIVPPSGNASPITINSCAPRTDTNSNANAPSIMGIPLTATSSGITIEFVNDANVAATLANFAVDSNGDHFVIRDVGTFSPGVSIKHEYRNGSGQGFLLPSFIAPSISCSVASVKFADGTSWRRGQPPAVRQPDTTRAVLGRTPHLSVTPIRVAIDRGTDSALFLVQSRSRVAGFREGDSCAGVASVFVAASGDTSVTYTVRPVAPGKCSAVVTDESGGGVTVPIIVQ